MKSARPLLLIWMLLLSGCTIANEDAVEPNISPDAREELLSIDWFSASSAPAGNRFTLSTGDEIIALDEPDSPWTIHVVYGDLLENRTEFLPSSEPLNIAATMGPRGPVVVYRSPGEMEYDLVVAELYDGNWIESKLTSNKGEIFGIPAVSGSESELIVGFPVLASVDGPMYSTIRLSFSIPTNLKNADRIDFPMAPLSPLGDVVVKDDSIAISYTKDLSFVNIHSGTWDEIRENEPKLIEGPTQSGFSRSIYSSLVMREDYGIAVALTELPQTAGMNVEPRPAVVHDLANGNRVYLNTYNLVDVWVAKDKLIAVLTGQNSIYHIGFANDEFTEIAQSACNDVALLENGVVITLGRKEGRWTSALGSVPDDVPVCE